jgi:hypothetical protein
MVGLTLLLIVTVLYGVVAGVRYLWSKRTRRARGRRATAERRGELDGKSTLSDSGHPI